MPLYDLKSFLFFKVGSTRNFYQTKTEYWKVSVHAYLLQADFVFAQTSTGAIELEHAESTWQYQVTLQKAGRLV